MKGVLLFHSETGTEGGWYAFQHDKFMGLPDDQEECSVCHFMRAYIERVHADGEAINPGFIGTPCAYEDHQWVPSFPNGTWSYEGLHRLKNTDHLKVWHPDTGDLLFDGPVYMERNTDLYTENSTASVYGLWVNQEPLGIDRDEWARWFLKEYPAELEQT